MVIEIKEKQRVIMNNLGFIIELNKMIGNANRRKIIDLCYKKQRTITELKNLLKSSNKVTWNNVKQLDKYCFVRLHKMNNKKGKPVYVESLAPVKDWIEVIAYFSNDVSNQIKRSKKLKGVFYDESD